MPEIMPGLEESIDCLFCGTQTQCTKFTVGDGGDGGTVANTNVAKWAMYLCDLLKVNEDELRKGVNDAYFCVECKRKVESFAKIQLLIDQMSEKVLEFRGKFEDSLYLSNFQNNEDSSSVLNQAQIRSKLMDAIEAERKKEREPKTAEVSVETEPVTILNEDMRSLNQGKLNASNEAISEKRKPHTVKIRMHDESMVKSIIQALSQPANSVGYRTLVVRGSTSSSESPQKQASNTIKQTSLSPSYVLDLDQAGGFLLENSEDNATVGNAAEASKPPSYTCPVCSMKLENAEERRRHRNTHKENGLYKCPHCVVGYNRQELLVVHVQNMHPDKLPNVVSESKPRRGRKPSGIPRGRRKRQDSESLTEESSNDSELELDDEEDEVVESPDEEWDPEEEKIPTRGRRKPTKVRVTPKVSDSSEINSSQSQPKRGRKTKIPVRIEGTEQNVSNNCHQTEDVAPAGITAAVKRRGRPPAQGRVAQNKVVKVSSSKVITTTTPNGTTEVYQASRQSDRIQLRHKFRQYFY